MSPLNLDRLENQKQGADGKMTYRCPACAAKEMDSAGEHLVVYPDGRFGCVAHPEDKKHRAEIIRLTGINNEPAPRRLVIEIKPLKIEPVRILQTLNFGSRAA